jgi:hypothetical protein
MEMTTAPADRPVFVLRLEGEQGRHSIHALRALLKVLLRRHRLRCVEAREETS